MTAWSWAAVALLAGGLGPAMILGARGSSIDRLVGVELAASVATITLLVMAQAAGQSSYLIVPLVLVLLSFAGTLVFTRLLGPRSS